MAATAILLMGLVTLGVSLDLTIRYKLQGDIYLQVERVAGQWVTAVRDGPVPHPIPASTGINLIQWVDAHGKVVDSSPRAEGKPPLSTWRPAPGDRLRPRTLCSPQGRCVMLTAIRISAAADAPVVYAGRAEPSILMPHRLEYLIAVSTLLIMIPATWMTWWAVGLILRPMQRQYQFASITAHELRTPITGLRLQLEEALLYPEDVDPSDTIRGALSATGRLEAIINDLLLQARLRAADTMPHELINLGALVKAEAALIHDVPVYVRATPDVRVSGSRIQLIRVVGNLLGNARRHANTRVDVTVESADGQAVVSVTDDGAGIAPADRERVFDRFTRLDEGRRRDSGGSGLGLAISRDITRAHHGTLRIEDSPRGARFVIRLPLPDQVPAPRKTKVVLRTSTGRSSFFP